LFNSKLNSQKLEFNTPLIVNRLEVWFFYFLFSSIKHFLHQSLSYCFLNWMVEINFMEVYFQPAKNIFEATIYHCIKYFKRVKEQ